MSKPTKRLPASSNDYRQVEQELRQKVKNLEAEVRTLKMKLDELRKAKNTTVLKKEKEFVTTVIPNRQPESSTQKTEENESIRAEYQAKIDELNQRLKELSVSKVAEEKDSAQQCGHEEIILALQSRLSEVESVNTALNIQNNQLEERLSQAYEEVSRKEAEHCESLEKTKMELQVKWQEMYKEWMKTTEAKIAELQAANDMMRRLLQRSSPNT